MTPALCSASAHQATSILHAWKTGDARRLGAALENALAPPAFHGSSPGELERTELLQAVALEIRKSWVASQPGQGASEEIEVCMGLLQHLVAEDL